MIIGKSQKEIDKMRAAGQLVGRVLQQLRGMVAPGITTLDVDRAAEKMIRDAGAFPTFKGYNGFPFSICASVNEQVVHGFPSSYELQEGDIFSIDVGATLEGFVGDTATTVPVGKAMNCSMVNPSPTGGWLASGGSGVAGPWYSAPSGSTCNRYWPAVPGPWGPRNRWS